MAFVPPIEAAKTIATPQKSLPVQMGSTDRKVNSLVEKVLEVIRGNMPITQLFRPELKIDLSQFVKDQQLFHRLAQFLGTLSTEDFNAKAIYEKCQATPLFAELSCLFNEPSAFLPLLWEACEDVLTKPASNSKFNDAIEGRIFTLKNAIIAQQRPNLIILGQTQNKLPLQIEQMVKEEGAGFLRESLRFHWVALQGSQKPFKEELRSVARQLVPFVSRITCAYLRENDKVCPDDPLTFRNPTGENVHGVVAAVIMEVCLNALGYNTRFLMRSDLEPKVSLATLKGLIEVSGSDGKHYYIDPCYIQFFKDIYSDKNLIPTEPILLLEETELDTFIEEKILLPWKSNYQRYRNNELGLQEELIRKDQYLAYAIQELVVVESNVPPNLEAWIRSAFQRIWKPEGYQPVYSPLAFQDLFHAKGQKTGTHQLIKSLAIPALIKNHLSREEIEKRLTQLLSDKRQHRKNAPEVLRLLSQVPVMDREKYGVLLDADQRNPNISVALKGYYRTVRNTVNPHGKNLTALYGCSGSDCSSILLATDATEIILVDMTPVTIEALQNAVQILNDPAAYKNTLATLNASDDFIKNRRKYLAGISTHTLGGQHYMNQLPFKLLFDLFQLSDETPGLIIEPFKDAIKLSFSWSYQENGPKKSRSFIYIQADITKPAQYPTTLQTKLKKGIDIFYMKGAFTVPRQYPQFLPFIAKSLKRDGWLMTADKAFSMETYDPTTCLEPQSLKFVTKKSEATLHFEESLDPPFEHFIKPPSLEIFSDRRVNRSSGTDHSYLTFLTCRQKLN